MLNKENTQEYSKDTLRIQIIDSKNNPIKISPPLRTGGTIL